MIKFVSTLFLLSLTVQYLYGGYTAPSTIDGCQSMDGKYVITAEQVFGSKTEPNKWKFIYTNNETNESRELELDGIQGSKIYAHLFIAPDGETFALWNHITMWFPGQHTGRGPGADYKELSAKEKIKDYRASNRLNIYKKDGTLIKSLGVDDFLQPGEEKVGTSFTRIEWLIPYDGMKFKRMMRQGYTFYRISPDYSVMEIKVGNKKKPRTVWVDLTTGNFLQEKPTDPNKIPVRPFLNEVEKGGIPEYSAKKFEAFRPGLDPVRIMGTYEGF